MKCIFASGLLLIVCTSSAQAGAIFYINDQAGFDAEVAPSSFNFRGIEDFENNTLPDPALFGEITGPLEPNSASSPAFFPNGTKAATGLTYQSNTGGASHNTVSPRSGAPGLLLINTGTLSSPTDQLLSNFVEDSIDMIFSLTEPVLAVSFLPLYLSSSSNPNQTGSLSIDVYDSSNVLLGSSTITGVDFLAGSFVGIVATGNDDIGRINLWDGNVAVDIQGADNIAVYASPPPSPPGVASEPASLALVGFGLAGLGFFRKRKH